MPCFRWKTIGLLTVVFGAIAVQPVSAQDELDKIKRD
jgi:hypothetical protein